MSVLPPAYARFFLDRIEEADKGQPEAIALVSAIRETMEDTLADKKDLDGFAESDEAEIEAGISENAGAEAPHWMGTVRQAELVRSPHSDRMIPKRNGKTAADALAIAHYACEADGSHKTFLRKDGTPYTEPHHLIPLSRFADFGNTSLNVKENIVSLCSNCHNLLHYGRM